MLLYYFLRFIGTIIINLLFFPKIVGKKNTKIKGKCIVISNHTSMWDPLIIVIAFRRHIYWMGKIELFKSRFSRIFFRLVRAFPVRRGEGDLTAIRHAFSILRKDKIIGMFPEGKRAKTGKTEKFEPGTSMIALKNNAPIIPIYIKGNYKFFRRIKLVIGEPILLSDYVGKKYNPEAVTKATKLLEDKIQDLEKKAQQV